MSVKKVKLSDVCKELGIETKAAIAKWKAEGFPDAPKNANTGISHGMAANIKAWAADGSLKDFAPKEEKAPAKKKAPAKTTRTRTSRKKIAGEQHDHNIEDQGAVAIAEPPESDVQEAAPTDTPTLTELEPSIEAKETPVPPASLRSPDTGARTHPVGEPDAQSLEQTAAKEAASAAKAPEVPEKPVRPTIVPRGVPNVVAKPTVVAVGPRNVPTPAQLQGPKVVRMDKPDNLAAPRSRPRPASTGYSPTMGPSDRPSSSGSAGHRGKSRYGAAPIDDDDGRSPKRKVSRYAASKAIPPVVDPIREWREADLLDRAERLASATGGGLRRRRSELSKLQNRGQAPHVPVQRPSFIEIIPPVTVRELSELLSVRTGELLKRLMNQGAMVTVNQSLDADVAGVLALEYGVELKIKQKESLYAAIERQFSEREKDAPTTPRPPIVTILGHVDHGKTSLLDKIRSANVAAGEAGGITQHIGAYTVTTTGSDGQTKRVTFLDTPGHQAFTAMRARGANLTDVVVLVIAADDGVMPQTVESIAHAKAAGVPIVVALNKIDKPEANANKVLGQLAENGLNPTEWGGDIEVVRTSATTGQGVKELIEYLDYTATLRELKASPQLPARGTVIEAFMDPLRGVVVRVMVQNGTLHVGDSLACGPAAGRVRLLVDDKGKSIQEAGPATPCEIIGLDNVPVGGDPFYVVDDLAHSKDIAQERARADREAEIFQRTKVTLENLNDAIRAGQVKELNMILKADVQGSVDVLRQTMTQELSKEVQVKLLHAAVGGISESDVLLAEASHAVIVGFSVTPDEAARKLAEQRGVEVRLYRVIYEITDDIRKALTGMLNPEKKEQTLGHAEIRQVIRVSKVGNIAGCMVTDGVLQRTCKYRLSRDGAVVTDGLTLDSLKRFKEDAREVRGGLECGLKLAGYDDIKVGDQLEAYRVVDVARTL